ncbi:hypothetical protein L9F63_018801 [Diploptera punctata]|uniref:Ionotropic glutamate receptor C-terminal domain-containing protein n=1 Tax=Diploptera punctata TaxID=6984 RepID=A0AAD7ZW56_DIPPU|nr:hypothetical protein L9F63_018801 [Diploptera punctata]
MLESARIQEDGLFETYSWYPYVHPEICAESYEPVLLDCWVFDSTRNRHFVRNINLFQNKIPDDLQGCPLVASSFDYPPLFSKIRHADTVDSSEGILSSLLQVLAKKLNMSIRFLEPPADGELWGRLSRNGTWSGVTGELLRRDSDLIATAYFTVHNFTYDLEFTVPYFIDHLKWYFPCPTPWPRWMSLSRVFRISLWLVNVVSHLIMSFAMHSVQSIYNKIIQNHVKLGRENFRLWVLHFGEIRMIGLSSVSPPNIVVTRIIFSSWVIYCMAMNNVYQTFLTSYFTNPGMHHKISNEDELLASRLRLGTHISVTTMFPELKTNPYKIDVLCETYDECQEIVFKHRTLAYLGPQSKGEYILAKKYINVEDSDVICDFHEDFVFEFLTLPVVRGFPFLTKFDEIILKLLEAGIVREWWDLFIFKTVLSAREKVEHAVDDYVMFSLQHLQSVFVCLFAGYTLSIVAFVTEIIWYILIKRRSLLRHRR